VGVGDVADPGHHAAGHEDDAPQTRRTLCGGDQVADAGDVRRVVGDLAPPDVDAGGKVNDMRRREVVDHAQHSSGIEDVAAVPRPAMPGCLGGGVIEVRDRHAGGDAVLDEVRPDEPGAARYQDAV
jgi:hypothetical protein